MSIMRKFAWFPRYEDPNDGTPAAAAPERLAAAAAATPPELKYA